MKLLFGLMAVVALTIGGCAFLERVAPSAVDEAGVPIAGTHELSSTAETVVGMTGPYGQAGAAVFLLVWNFAERFRRKKTESGLMATVRAIENAGNDPATKAEIAKIKAKLAEAHQMVDATSLIKSLLAKL